MQDLNNLMKEYLETNAKIKALEFEKENLKAKIKILLVTHDIDQYEDEDTGNLLTYKTVVRKIWDPKKIAELVEDVNELKKESISETLRIVAPEVEE